MIRMRNHSTPRLLRLLCAGAGIFWAGLTAGQAQLLKLGPIDFSSSLTLQAEYSTNADQLPEGEEPPNGEAREDFFITYGITFGGRTRVYPDIDINLSVAIQKEKHFIQEDEDPPSSPILGSSTFAISRNLGHYNYSLHLSHIVDAEYNKDEVFKPAGVRKGRDITQTSAAGVGLGWLGDRFSISGLYDYERERHNELFNIGDTDRQTIAFNTAYKLLPRVSPRVTATREKEKLPNQLDDPANGIWEDTIFVGVDFEILRRPSLRYSVGAEKEDEGVVKGKWGPQHTVALSDSRALAPTLTLGYNASYVFEQQQEQDDITFQYGANLNHRAPFNFTQAVTATREPVSTFGSTTDTDNTTYSYSLGHPSFFIPRMSMLAMVSLEHQKPAEVVSPTEDTVTYTLSFVRSFPIARRWNASLSYVFSREDRTFGESGDSGVAAPDELVDEHLFTLTMSYLLF